MSDTLEFGFKKSRMPNARPRLSVQVPNDLLRQTIERNSEARDMLNIACGNHFMSRLLSDESDAETYLFNTASTRKILPKYRDRAVSSASRFLEQLTLTATIADRHDPRVFVWYATTPGRPLLEATVQLPELDDARATEVVTTHMQAFAKGFKQDTAEMPEATILANLDRGMIRLDVDQSCSIGVAVASFTHEVETGVVDLQSQNLLRTDQQMIALAGAVALGHADSLAAIP